MDAEYSRILARYTDGNWTDQETRGDKISIQINREYGVKVLPETIWQEEQDFGRHFEIEEKNRIQLYK